MAYGKSILLRPSIGLEPPDSTGVDPRHPALGRRHPADAEQRGRCLGHVLCAHRPFQGISSFRLPTMWFAMHSTCAYSRLRVVCQHARGAVFVEYVFGWRGMGLLMFRALEQSDLPVVLGVFRSLQSRSLPSTCLSISLMVGSTHALSYQARIERFNQ